MNGSLKLIHFFQAENVEDSIDQTWIVNGQSDEQKLLLSQHPKTNAVFVEGPHIIWLRDTNVTYYVLRGDPIPEKLPQIDNDGE